jgi:GT2 family glycosyltransferase
MRARLLRDDDPVHIDAIRRRPLLTLGRRRHKDDLGLTPNGRQIAEEVGATGVRHSEMRHVRRNSDDTKVSQPHPLRGQPKLSVMMEPDVQHVVGASLVLWHSDLDQATAATRSLVAQDLPVDYLVVVINDDADGRVSRDVEDRFRSILGRTRLTVRSLPYNSGFAGGQDLALSQLFAGGCDQALVLNPDVVLDPSCVRELAIFAAGRGAPVLVGPLLELASHDLVGEGTIDTAGIRWTIGGRHLDALQGHPLGDAPTSPAPVRGISGAAMLVTRGAYQRLVDMTGEFFDEDFIAYREDAELAFRAELLGIECWLVPAAVAQHVRSLRGTSRKTTPWVNALGVRNRFLIASKYGIRRPGIWPLPWFRDLVVVSAVIVQERESLPALLEAWKLRRRMRAKGRKVLAARVSLSK